MKHTRTIEVRAYTHSRPMSIEDQLSLQVQAKSAALQSGKNAEADRCAERFEEIKLRRDHSKPPPLQFKLGPAGTGDAIFNMFRTGQLSRGEVEAALALRAYERGEPIGVGGIPGSGSSEYVDGRKGLSMEAYVDLMSNGRWLKNRIKDNLGEHFPIVWQAILGNISLTKGIKRIRKREETARNLLKKLIRESLKDAEAYIGAKQAEAA